MNESFNHHFDNPDLIVPKTEDEDLENEGRKLSVGVLKRQIEMQEDVILDLQREAAVMFEFSSTDPETIKEIRDKFNPKIKEAEAVIAELKNQLAEIEGEIKAHKAQESRTKSVIEKYRDRNFGKQ